MATIPINIAAWVRDLGVWKRTKPQVKSSLSVWLHVVTNQTKVSTVWKFAMCNAANAINNPAVLSVTSLDFFGPRDAGAGLRYNADGSMSFFQKPGTASYVTSDDPWLLYDTTWWTYLITWTDTGSHSLDTVPIDLTDAVLGAVSDTFQSDVAVAGVLEIGTFSTIIIDQASPGPAPTLASYNLTVSVETT